MAFFRARGLLRSLLAILAAYAMALQMLLTSIAGWHPLSDSPGPAVICLASGNVQGDGHDQPPVEHPPCLLCILAATCFAVLASPHAPALRSDAGSALAWKFSASVRSDRAHAPNWARGPPPAA